MSSSLSCSCSSRHVDVIWVILSVEVGGLLGVTQQLSSFQAEFNTQPHRSVHDDYNPFASPHNATQGDCSLTDSTPTQHTALSNSSVTTATNNLQNTIPATYDQVRVQRRLMYEICSVAISQLQGFQVPYVL